MEELVDYWETFFSSDQPYADWWARKKEICKKRDATIVRIQGEGNLYQELRQSNRQQVYYNLHLKMFVKQSNTFYLEEQYIPYQFHLKNNAIRNHTKLSFMEAEDTYGTENLKIFEQIPEESRFSYDRLAAVKYANRWWNSYNPSYRKFDVDCTNYISQCLFAGGAPMRGAPNRNNGWWYNASSWSFSWAVAHSLRWYLSGSTSGLKGKEMGSAAELIPGDVICYDFEGDGRWNHNTIVVAKDANGEPLVNAHTTNSKNRYWSYEDSTAWTPNIAYKFFRIGE
ncbi:amidase domain-containing protein [Virgibacillus flavescens]|uniref:amidase domain-containing protein n=1 Tax=Virgibacillus flavescens TaxID=1611422 RepID=UPI003D34133B